MNENHFRVILELNESLPAEVMGKTLEEVFLVVKEKNHQIIEKIKMLTGGSIPVWTPEVEKVLTKDEIMYLRLAKMFRELGQGKEEKELKPWNH